MFIYYLETYLLFIMIRQIVMYLINALTWMVFVSANPAFGAVCGVLSYATILIQSMSIVRSHPLISTWTMLIWIYGLS